VAPLYDFVCRTNGTWVVTSPRARNGAYNCGRLEMLFRLAESSVLIRFLGRSFSLAVNVEGLRFLRGLRATNELTLTASSDRFCGHDFVPSRWKITSVDRGLHNNTSLPLRSSVRDLPQVLQRRAPDSHPGPELDHVELVLFCADLCRAFDRGMSGKKPGEPNGPVYGAVNY